MKSIKLSVRIRQSAIAEEQGVILSPRKMTSDECTLVIGSPGLPNKEVVMENGDAYLYETTGTGILEIRMIGIEHPTATFLVTSISPRAGLLAGATSQDESNSPFSPEELRRISSSVEKLRTQLDSVADILPEQLALVHQKLADIEEASKRLGRKDWINYTAGTLTSLAISAAFDPGAAKRLFELANAAFSWLFSAATLALN